MKEKWKFEMEKWEKRALGLILVLAAGLSISGMAYFVHIYDPRELLEFESIGWELFWQDFPYYWLGGAITFWVLATILWLKLGDNYQKKPLKIALISGIILVVITAGVLFLS